MSGAVRRYAPGAPPVGKAALSAGAREPLGMRLRRVLHAAVDEATPRLASFVFRNRRDLPVSPVEGWSDLDRPEIVNPPLTTPTSHSRECPKIIFQTWKSRKDVPDNYRYWRSTFVSKNPDHLVILWDDADNRKFIADYYPWFLDVYDKYPAEIFRADAVRYFFMYHYGGLYADMDTECLAPVAHTTAGGDVILCRMGANPKFQHSVPNAVMASRPGQIFWLYVIQLMMEASTIPVGSTRHGPEAMTGPILLKRAFDGFSGLDTTDAWAAVRAIRRKLKPEQQRMMSHGSINLLPPRAWYPLDWTNPMHKLLRSQLISKRQLLPHDVARSLFPRSAVVTYWSHSW
jgi:inositol phosphorylceramide mannosyltransferase catalytic subunit